MRSGRNGSLDLRTKLSKNRTYKLGIDLCIAEEVVRNIEPDWICIRLIRKQLDEVPAVCLESGVSSPWSELRSISYLLAFLDVTTYDNRWLLPIRKSRRDKDRSSQYTLGERVGRIAGCLLREHRLGWSLGIVLVARVLAGLCAGSDTVEILAPHPLSHQGLSSGFKVCRRGATIREDT